MIIDDLLATGGTLAAAEKLIENIPKAQVVGHVVIFEIASLNGRKKVKNQVASLMTLRD